MSGFVFSGWRMTIEDIETASNDFRRIARLGRLEPVVPAIGEAGDGGRRRIETIRTEPMTGTTLTTWTRDATDANPHGTVSHVVEDVDGRSTVFEEPMCPPGSSYGFDPSDPISEDRWRTALAEAIDSRASDPEIDGPHVAMMSQRCSAALRRIMEEVPDWIDADMLEIASPSPYMPARLTLRDALDGPVETIRGRPTGLLDEHAALLWFADLRPIIRIQNNGPRARDVRYSVIHAVRRPVDSMVNDDPMQIMRHVAMMSEPKNAFRAELVERRP